MPALKMSMVPDAHRRACEIIHSGPGDFVVGPTFALHDFQAGEGGEAKMAKIRREIADVYLEPLGGDDVVGVQNYVRMLVGPEGLIQPGPDAVLNQMGEAFYPEALGGAVRYAAVKSGARFSSPRTASPPPMTPSGWNTCGARSRAWPRSCRPASTSAGISTGRCSTTSGLAGIGRRSAWSVWIERLRLGRSSRARVGSARWRGPINSRLEETARPSPGAPEPALSKMTDADRSAPSRPQLAHEEDLT